MSIITLKACAAAVAGVLLAVTAGCGSSSSAYTPGTEDARQALEATLTTWRDGKKADTLATRTPPVQAIDFRWQSGQVLERFEIVKEEPSDSRTVEKRFVVKMKLKSSPQETETRYMVLGLSPMQVYHEDDYARTMSMDNNPKPPSAGRRR